MRRPSLSEGILGGDQTSQPARSFSASPFPRRGAAPSNSPLPTLRCRQLGMVSGDLGNVCLQRPRLGPHPTLSGRSLRPPVPQPLSSRWRAPPHPARHCP